MSDGAPERPRPRARVAVDPSNAYARLGVSPLSTTEEIARTLRERQNKLRQAARRAGGDGETEEIVALQAIEDEIGTPRARAAYDQRFPQNELLTVQPAPRDRALDPARRPDVIPAWLLEELGAEAAVLSPSSLAWWAPAGLSDALREALRGHVAAPEAGGGGDAPGGLSVAELNDLGPRGGT